MMVSQTRKNDQTNILKIPNDTPLDKMPQARGVKFNETMQYNPNLSRRSVISRFEALLQSLEIPEEKWGDFLVSVANEMLRSKNDGTIALPSRAPRMYENKIPGAHKNIVLFMEDVWGPWLKTKSMSRADLFKIDRKAYVALQNYQKNHGLPEWLDKALPRKSEVHDEILKRLRFFRNPEDVTIDQAERRRLADVARKRRQAKRRDTQNSI